MKFELASYRSSTLLKQPPRTTRTTPRATRITSRTIRATAAGGAAYTYGSDGPGGGFLVVLGVVLMVLELVLAVLTGSTLSFMMKRSLMKSSACNL